MAGASSTTSGDHRVTGAVILGNTTVPASVEAGAGPLDTTNKGDGSLRLRNDGLPQVKHNGAAKPLGLAQHALEMRLAALTPNGVTSYVAYAPRDLRVTGVSRRYLTAPSSAAGAVAASLKAGARQLLNTASEDETGLSADTLTPHSLTGTASDLVVSRGEKLLLEITSNNADLTGGTEPLYYLYYEDN